MNWFERLLKAIACAAVSLIAALLIPILIQVVAAAWQAASVTPSCEDLLAKLVLALGISCPAYQTAVKAWGWLMAIGLTLILIGLIVAVVRCWISVFSGPEEEHKPPSVDLTCGPYLCTPQASTIARISTSAQAGAIAQISTSAPDVVVQLSSSDPSKVAFAQASIVGSGTVQLIVGDTPSAAVGDITLTAVAQTDDGTATATQQVSIVELTGILVRYPLSTDGTGTFTSRAAENVIGLEAQMVPPTSALSNSVTWTVDDDPRDAVDCGDPADPPAGMTAQFSVNPPPASNGRGAPLSYRIRATLTVNGQQQSQTNYATQDEIDQCRQEYIDMGKNTVPHRGDFVSAATYVDPGSFAFHEINSGDYSVAVFAIAQHLQNIRNQFGHPMAVNSGYRNPVHNMNLPGSAPESRHIYGRAADIDVRDFNGDGVVNGHISVDANFGSCGDDWALLANEAVTEGPSYIEPWSQTGGWVHMEW